MIALSYLFTAVLSMTVIGSLLFLLFLPISAMAEKKFSPRWNYFMHLVVLSFFIIPVGALVSRFLPPIARLVERAPFQSPMDFEAVSDFMLTPPLMEASKFAFSWTAFSKEILPLIWLLGVIVFALYHLGKQIAFQRKILATSTPITHGFALDQLRAQKKALEITKEIHLLSNPVLVTPILTGIRTCYLIFPTHWEEEKDIGFSINHELTHVKNKDLLTKKIALLLHGIHWFNPLFYLFRHRLNLMMEYCCDKQMATSLDQTQRKEYAHTILHAMVVSDWDGSLSSGLGSKKNSVKRRIINMMKENKPGKILKLLSVLLVVALAGTGVWLGISRGEEAPPAIEEPSPIAAVDGIEKISAKQDESPNTIPLVNKAEEEAVSEKQDESPNLAPAVAEESESATASLTEEEMAQYKIGEYQEPPFEFIWPTTGGYISTGVGSYPGHMGMDIAGNGGVGSPVYASQSGVIVKAVNGDTGYGNYIVIDHGQGWQTFYAHMDELQVKEGDEILVGEQIGTSGRSGRVTGPCLHFEVRKDGTFLNGEQYVTNNK